jgi:cytoskeletal protein CcmA (bactofilin family)
MTTVEKNQTTELSSVDGDLEVNDGAVIVVPSDKPLKISGKLISDGDVEIQGSVEAQRIEHTNGYLTIDGNVKAEEIEIEKSTFKRKRRFENDYEPDEDGNITISSKIFNKIIGAIGSRDGNNSALIVSGDLECKDLNCAGKLQVDGNTSADNYDVKGSASHGADFNAVNAMVGGSLRVELHGEITEAIKVGGSARFQSLNCPEINAGGSFKVKEEVTTENLRSGGSFKADVINAKEIRAGGSLRATKIFAENMRIGGSIKADEVELDNLKVGGSGRIEKALIRGDYKASGTFSFGELRRS